MRVDEAADIVIFAMNHERIVWFKSDRSQVPWDMSKIQRSRGNTVNKNKLES